MQKPTNLTVGVVVRYSRTERIVLSCITDSLILVTLMFNQQDLMEHLTNTTVSFWNFSRGNHHQRLTSRRMFVYEDPQASPLHIFSFLVIVELYWKRILCATVETGKL